LLVLAVPLSYWLTRGRVKNTVDKFAVLPALLSPAMLAAGTWLCWRHPAAVTPLGLVVGLVACGLPFAVPPIVRALARIDPRLLEEASCLGRSRTATFLLVVLPLAWTGILSGVVLGLLHAIGQLGALWWLTTSHSG
jgi:molybdate transport system permease protein